MKLITAIVRPDKLDEVKAALFAVEGRALLTDEAAARITYTARLQDPTGFDPLFVQALAARLAAELCVPIAKSAALSDRLWRVSEAMGERAALEDAREGSAQVVTPNPYLTARS